MPSWSAVNGSGISQEAAMAALATACGVTDAQLMKNVTCSKNNATGQWTCSIMKFTP